MKINLPVIIEGNPPQRFGTVAYDTDANQFDPNSYEEALARAGVSSDTHELDIQGNKTDGDVACILPLK